MTTIAEKVNQFVDLFGDKAKEILSAAEHTEKQADDAGVDYKEAPAADTPAAEAQPETETPAAAAETVEAKEAPAPAAPEVEAEKAPKEPAKEAIDEEEAEMSDEEEFEAMGDMEAKEYGRMMGEVMTKAMGPVMESLARIEKAMTAKKEAPEVPAVDPNQAKIAELEQTVKELTLRLGTLTSEMPRAVAAGFVASQAAETVLKEGSPLQSATGPKPDPLNEFTSFAMGGLK